MDLTKITLPSSVEVEGSFYAIKTDFRYWLMFARLLENEKAVIDEADFLYKDEIPQDKKAGFQKLLEFYSPKKELPRNLGGGSSEKVMDYDIDADLIYAAFYEVYKLDLMEVDKNGHFKELHWHKFQALFAGLHNTKLNEIIGYRCYDENDKTDYKANMKKLKQMWTLPTKMTEEDKKDLDKFNALFN